MLLQDFTDLEDLNETHRAYLNACMQACFLTNDQARAQSMFSSIIAAALEGMRGALSFWYVFHCVRNIPNFPCKHFCSPIRQSLM